MLETPHAIVGAAIATQIPNPAIALPLAFASHFILDMTPHWNPHLNTELNSGGITRNTIRLLSVDVLAALALGSFVALNFSTSPVHMVTIFLGAFAGVLPDVIEAPYFFLGWKTKFVKKWLAFQKSIQVDTTIVPGLLTQVATIIAAFWWIAGS